MQWAPDSAPPLRSSTAPQETPLLQRSLQPAQSLLPLPAPIARAIVAYLRRGRPPTPERRVFVHHRVAVGKGLTSGSVRAAIRLAFERSHEHVSSKGTHALRHTAATHMVKGAQDVGELRAIADLLGHSPEMLMTVYAHALPQNRQAIVDRLTQAPS